MQVFATQPQPPVVYPTVHAPSATRFPCCPCCGRGCSMSAPSEVLGHDEPCPTHQEVSGVLADR